MKKSTTYIILTFVGMTVLAVSVMIGIYLLTIDTITNNNKIKTKHLLEQVLPIPNNNQIIYNKLVITSNKQLPSTIPVIIYIIKTNQKLVGVIFHFATPSGYSGPIELLIGINADNTVSGVRVINHKETPGLGDKMETKNSDWIYSFNGRSINNQNSNQWAIKKDGGDFDAWTGASITPRAIVKAVAQALTYFKNHRDKILNDKSNSTN